jgi:phage gp45-like
MGGDMTGIVRGWEVGKNRNGTKDVLKLQVEVSGPEDIQTVEYMSHAGDDHIPPKGTIVTILAAGSSWKIAVASSDENNFTAGLAEGERKIYDPTGGGAFIIFRTDGTIEVNGDADFATAFNDLKAGFDQLVSDVNALVTAYNAHTHVAVTSLGTPTPPVPTGLSSAATIDAAKVDTVKMP